MNKITFLSVYCIITLCSVTTKVVAQDIKVYTEILPPFQTFINNEISGSATQKVKSILQSAGFTPQFHIVPWARAFQSAAQQENTLIYSMHRSPEREPLFHWLAIVAQIKVGFVGLTARQLKITSINEAKNYVTAVVRNGYAFEYLSANGFSEDKNMLVVNSRDAQVNLLFNQKVDFVFLDLAFIREELMNRNLSPLLVEHVLTRDDWSRDLYLAINKNSSNEIINRIKISTNTLPPDK